MKNDGWTDLFYDFGEGQAVNEELSNLLNEAVHVFRYHADGHWKQHYKPTYAAKLAEHIAAKPRLIRKLLNLKDPVVSNITYAAIELAKAEREPTRCSHAEPTAPDSDAQP